LAISAVNAWRERARPTVWQVVEGAGIAMVLAGLSAWELATEATYAFLLALPVLWAALRFEFRGVSLAVLGLAFAIGLYAQSIDLTQVSAADVAQLHTRMQARVLVAASTGLIVAALIRQQRQEVSDLARANAELEARVAERTRAIEAAERRFKATFENAGVGISCHRLCGPWGMKPVACCGCRRRRGRACPWCGATRVSVGPGLPEAPSLASWASLLARERAIQTLISREPASAA
jgi:hypothetical protein